MKDGSVSYINYHAMGGKSLQKENITVHSGNISIVVENFKKITVYSAKESKHKYLLQEKGFKEEVKEFVKAVKNSQEAISFDSLINTTLVTFAIEKSLKTSEVIFIDDMKKLI